MTSAPSRLRLVSDEGPDGREQRADGQDDRRLLERSLAGDTEAWARLYQDNFPALLRHVTYMVMDAAVAEDLVQEAFAVAFANIDKYDPRSPLARGSAASPTTWCASSGASTDGASAPTRVCAAPRARR